MKVKVESEKSGLKPNIQKIRIMASSPITSWQIDGKKVETVADFIFLEGGNRQSWTPSYARLRTLGYTHGRPPSGL